MRALPARRLALGACCAALLVGITGPTALAADTPGERTRAASADALLVQVRSLDAYEGELTPVADLLEAVLGADDGLLSPSEVGRLGEAAREALEEAVKEGEKTPEATEATEATEVPGTTAPAAADTLPADTGDDLASDRLADVRDAVDDLLDLLLSAGEEGAAEVDPSVDRLLAEVDGLVDALLGTDPQVSLLPAPAGAEPPAQTPLLPGLTLPVLTPLTAVLPPSS